MIPSARYLPSVPCWVPPAGGFAPNRMFYWAWLIRDALRREKEASMIWFQIFERWFQPIWQDLKGLWQWKVHQDLWWSFLKNLGFHCENRLETHLFGQKDSYYPNYRVTMSFNFWDAGMSKFNFKTQRGPSPVAPSSTSLPVPLAPALWLVMSRSSWINQTVGLGPQEKYSNAFLVSLELRYS